jgi:RND family efflux transporter MFP subunit
VAFRKLAWVGLILGAGGGACHGGDHNRAQGMPPMPVELQTVRATPIADTSDYVAVLRSRRSVRIQPQVEGHVTRILVAPGDDMKPGQPLMSIDPARQQAVVNSQRAAEEANRANLDFLRAQFERQRKLFARGAATRQDFDQSQSALKQAEATAASTAAQAHAGAVELRYYSVVAPQAGTLGDIPVRVGDFVTPQTLLTTLDDNDVLEAYLQVPSERAMNLRLGTAVDIEDAAGKSLAKSKITFVSPRVDPDTQTVLTTATVDNKDGPLRAGQFVRARVVWSERTGPTVPVLAVQSRAGQTFVWVANRANAQAPLTVAPRPVELGPVQGQSYPVLHGLAPGEEVVASGVQKLRPGAPVVPAPPGGGAHQPG